MTSPHYYANEQNHPVGHFTIDELTRMRDQALIRDDTFVCIEDGSDWIPVSQVATDGHYAAYKLDEDTLLSACHL